MPHHAHFYIKGENRTFAGGCMEVCYADFSDLRCKSANFRSGEPFNKRSVFEQFDRSLEGSLEAAKVGDFTAINEWAIPQLNAD
jgi:hypothetical protein